MSIDAAPGATWGEVLDQARTGTDPDRAESLLTAIIAAALALSPESIHERRVGGFPPGVPSKSIVRSAAQLLLDLTSVSHTARSHVRRALAWTQLLRFPQQKVVTAVAPGGEIIQAVENCRHALTELGDHGDPVDRAIVEIQLARYLRRVNQPHDAIAALTHIQPGDRQIVGDEVRPRILREAPFLGDFLVEKIGFKRAELLCNAYRDVSLVEHSMRQVEIAREHARRYADADPTNFTYTWLLEGHLHRRSRDVHAVLRMEKKSRDLAAQYPQSSTARRHANTQASANADLFQDFSRAQEFRYQRLQNRLKDDLGIMFEGQPSIEELMGCVAHYRQLNSKAAITWLGNIAWAITSGYVRSGDTAVDPQIRAYAEGLLDVAEAAWDGFAGNGVSSLLYGRARLALMSGDAPTVELTTDLLTASRNAYQWATAQNALTSAVRHGVAGSDEVRHRLDERLAEFDLGTSYVAHAKTLGLSAEWWWRAATTGIDIDWVRVETEALTATEMLRIEGVSLAPESEATAWMAAARAVAETTPDEQTERLRRLLRGIGCVTELMLTIATTIDRRRIAEKFAALFTDAADLAVTLGDHEAADLIMEAVRRDRVGLLLAELARNRDVDTNIRAAALAVQDAGSATVDLSGTNPDEDTKGKENGRGLRGRSNEIAVDRAAAVKAAESVLGPLSALADSSHLYTATTTAVLDRRGLTAVPTAVLQLLPLSRGTDAVGSGGEWVPLLRRVTISISGRPTEQFTDRVEVARLTLDLHPGDDDTFEWRENYTPRLLPQPLIELLAATNPEAPIRLMIVPTGFFHIPFDALPVTADTAVLDHALVSIHGSLTSALSLMALDEQRTPTPSLALYDHTLTHARPELDTLLAALDGVRRVESHQDLDLEMSVDGAQPYSLLAMAVHGSADEHGWGQAKKLRDADGNTVWVTAAQALSWTVPRLCVLASCNTPISAPDGIEIGGFPLALMLRGATTVIGGLYNIDDKATSAIMIAFWNRLAAGETALAALRHAKLDYLQQHPDHRHTWPEYWAGLTVYGAPNT